MKKFKLLPLNETIHKLEDSIITLSGPALAISGIIAGVDLVTGGHVMQNIPWLTVAWAICLLLTLDFQVLALGARAHKVYLSDKRTGRKIFEVVLIILVAAAISYVSIQMQSIIARVNSANLTIDQAAGQLGINTIALIWERSALVLILIFLSGWFREDTSETSETVSVSPVLQPTISDETMQLILSKLAKLDELEKAITGEYVAVIPERETPLALPETVGETDETEESEPGLEAQIRALLIVKADLSSRDIATIVGRPHTTVYRALARVKQVKQE